MLSIAEYLELQEEHQRALEQYEKEIENLKQEKYDMEEDIAKLTYFLNRFIFEGNRTDKTLEEAYAKMFEIYKSEGYEKYI